MERFRARREEIGPAAFRIVGPGAADEANGFLAQLAVRGRSAHTQRAYALGLADLLTWLAAEGLPLAEVDRGVVERYIAAFRSGPKAGAARVDVGRAGELNPRTRKPGTAPDIVTSSV